MDRPFFSDIPMYDLKDLHGKQVTLRYSSDYSKQDDITVEVLIAVEELEEGKKRIYVLSSEVKEGCK